MPTKKDRQFKRDLIQFLRTFLVQIKIGNSPSNSWSYALTLVPANSNAHKWLQQHETSFKDHLEHLSQKFPLVSHRLWFGILRELYLAGSPLTPFLTAMAKQLQTELEQEFESHKQKITLKTNTVLLIFFLPPVLLLIFAPILLELANWG